MSGPPTVSRVVRPTLRSPRFRPPRRLRFHRAGWVVSGSAVALGVAAIATGNNLLFLMLGAMLGLIVLSGWLSEVALRGVRVERRVPSGVQAGSAARLHYQVHNAKRRLPSFALEVGERGHPARGFVPTLAAGATTSLPVERRWTRRGVYPLETVTLTTSFPFGLFQKERDLEVPGEVVVWPRTDRPVREPRPAGDRTQRGGELAAGLSGARGEYRSLRPFRPGDDPRDVHWRATARSGEPVVREYAREQARTLWLCLDLRGEAPTAAEEAERGASPEEDAVEIAAALAAGAVLREQPVALSTADQRVEQGTGPSHLERVLDALARARFRPDAPPPPAPVPPGECVLVAPRRGAGGAGWGEVYAPGEAE